jgi:hypothetical protein
MRIEEQAPAGVGRVCTLPPTIAHLIAPALSHGSVHHQQRHTHRSHPSVLLRLGGGHRLDHR